MFFFLWNTATTSNEYLVFGEDPDNLTIRKKTTLFGGLYHSYELINLSPVNYDFQVRAFTIDENNDYIGIPITFTIGPSVDNADNLRHYTVLLGYVENVEAFVETVIDLATFTLASSVTMQHVLTPEFRGTVRHNIDKYLRQYGMRVYDDWVEFDWNEEIEEEEEEVPVLVEHDEIEIDDYEYDVEHDEIEIDYNERKHDEIKFDYYDV